MNFEIGIFSLGEVVPDPVTGTRPDSRQRLRDIIEQAEAAERAGLTVIGVGENHGTDVVAASPVVLLSAIAGRTHLLRLTTAVSVLTAGDPVRLYEQIAMLDNISGGRAELIVGRGASQRVLRALGLEQQDHDALFEEKLRRLLTLRETSPPTFAGPLARDGVELELEPRPLQPCLPIWLGSSGTPASVARAGALGRQHGDDVARQPGALPRVDGDVVAPTHEVLHGHGRVHLQPALVGRTDGVEHVGEHADAHRRPLPGPGRAERPRAGRQKRN